MIYRVWGLSRLCGDYYIGATGFFGYGFLVGFLVGCENYMIMSY